MAFIPSMRVYVKSVGRTGEQGVEVVAASEDGAFRWEGSVPPPVSVGDPIDLEFLGEWRPI